MTHNPIGAVAHELRETKLFWLLLFVPVTLILPHFAPESHRTIFFVSVAAIIPLAALLSRATEGVAAKTGDAVGGLLNATLGNLTELVIALTALKAGMFDLVKASVTGAVVTNSLFMLGGAFLLGGLRHRVQEFNFLTARMQTGMLILAAVALIVPSAVGRLAEASANEIDLGPYQQQLAVGLAILLIAVYGLGMVHSLITHRDVYASGAHGEEHAEEKPWPLAFAIGALAVATVFIALVSEVFVESVQVAAEQMGMSPAFVGFVVVSVVGGAAEMMTAFSAARKNRVDLSVSIAMGSSTQIALFVAPVLVLASYLVAPAPMDLVFRPGQVLMVVLTAMTVGFLAAIGRSTWFVGVQLLAVYAVFAVTLYLLPAG